jgi:transcriptional regulator with XRE-family HTH domain
LLRCCLSRVENGHTVPSVETLEKLAQAMEIPMYQLFYDGERPPKPPSLPNHGVDSDSGWGSTGKDKQMLGRFRKLLSRSKERDQKLLLMMAQKMAQPIGTKS